MAYDSHYISVQFSSSERQRIFFREKRSVSKTLTNRVKVNKCWVDGDQGEYDNNYKIHKYIGYARGPVLLLLS